MKIRTEKEMVFISGRRRIEGKSIHEKFSGSFLQAGQFSGKRAGKNDFGLVKMHAMW